MGSELRELFLIFTGLALLLFGFWLLFPQWFEDVMEEYFAPVRDLWRGFWRL